MKTQSLESKAFKGFFYFPELHKKAQLLLYLPLYVEARFERVWEKPDTALDKLRPYRAVLSPDFSMYLEMAPVLQLYNVFCNRWCGAY